MAHQMGTVSPLQALEPAFKVFDKDGDGTISPHEMMSVMRELGECISEDDAARMMSCIDVNNDGKVDYVEFCKFVTHEMQQEGVSTL